MLPLQNITFRTVYRLGFCNISPADKDSTFAYKRIFNAGCINSAERLSLPASQRAFGPHSAHITAGWLSTGSMGVGRRDGASGTR